jgi:hypothetical protein
VLATEFLGVDTEVWVALGAILSGVASLVTALIALRLAARPAKVDDDHAS